MVGFAGGKSRSLVLYARGMRCFLDAQNRDAEEATDTGTWSS